MLSLDDAVAAARQGDDLSAQTTGHCIDQMLTGEASPELIASLLLALRDKGEAVSELVGAAWAMRRHMTRIEHSHAVLLDTCGTGGSGSGTFNISTAVAIVLAACGVAVAKHGNRRATSKTGSADVLECLGVAIASEPDEVSRTLDRAGICFCFAAKLHPAMRHVIDIRRSLGVPTLFNLLGPLCNPAGATHQLLGTASPEIQTKIAAALAELETTRSFVVHADDGQDEVSLDGMTRVIDVTPGRRINEAWSPDDFSLSPTHRRLLAADDPAASAKIIREIFDGQPGPPRDTVLAGAAAGLLLVDRVASLREGVQLAAQTIDDGAAHEKLNQLRCID